MSRFDCHLFVCENVRAAEDPRGCCSQKGSVKLRAALKAEIARCGLAGKVRANSAGCLDACEHGASMVVYPGAVWYGGVTVADVPEIVAEHVIGGRPVERLRIRAYHGGSDHVREGANQIKAETGGT
jgi:(2Fe-2S) ferredoxin